MLSRAHAGRTERGQKVRHKDIDKERQKRHRKGNKIRTCGNLYAPVYEPAFFLGFPTVSSIGIPAGLRHKKKK